MDVIVADTRQVQRVVALGQRIASCVLEAIHVRETWIQIRIRAVVCSSLSKDFLEDKRDGKGNKICLEHVVCR